MKAPFFKRWMILFLALLVSGCVSTWSLITQPDMQGPDGRYTVTVPTGWVYAAFIQNGICISKDGPSLNWIEMRHISKKEAFEKIGVEIKDTVLPSELAEYTLAHFKENYTGGTVRLIGTEPARISDLKGFRMHLETTDSKGLIDDYVIYGVADNDFFYRLLYRAPRLHYFRRDLPTYEAVAASFRITPSL